MKKILFSLLLLLPALWAGATWFTSNNTEAVLDTMLSNSNEQIAGTLPFLSIEKQSFKKGFTSSSAQSIVTLDADLFDREDGSPIKITLNHKIYHGPMMMTPNGIKTGSSYTLTTLDQASLPTEAKKLITLLFKGQPPFSAGVTTGTSDDIDVDFNMAPLSYNAAKFVAFTGEAAASDDVNIVFDGMDANFTTNGAASYMRGSMQLGEMTVTGNEDGKEIDMRMSASTANIDIDELYKGSLLDGKIEFFIPTYAFSDGEGTDITLSDMRIASSAGDSNGLMHGEGTFDIATLHINTSDNSFNFPDAKIHFGFGMDGLERAGIMKLIDVGQELQTSQVMLFSSDDIDTSSEIMIEKMLAYYREAGNLIKQGVSVNSVLNISNANGKAGIKLDLDYIDTKELYALKTVKALATALQGKLAINIDKSILAGTPLEESIAMPIMMGFAVEKDNVYESVAALNNGELKVNNNAMPFLEMLGDQPLPWDEIFGM